MPKAMHTFTQIPSDLSSEKICHRLVSASPSRRMIFAGAGALLAGAAASTAGWVAIGAPSTAANPDATLIRVSKEFENVMRKMNVMFETIEDDDDRDIALEPLHKERNALFDASLNMRALTVEGAQARARMIVAFEPELRNGDGQWDMDMLAALLRDLTPEIGS